MGRNVELKALDPDPRLSREVCRAIGAASQGIVRQRDTYFSVPNGHLKLREERPGRAYLIHYERAARPQQRSAYRIAEVDDAEAVRSMLNAALGTAVVVGKRRHIFL